MKLFWATTIALDFGLKNHLCNVLSCTVLYCTTLHRRILAEAAPILNEWKVVILISSWFMLAP